MTANAVISGDFAELRSVKSRSVVQMLIEVPIERAADIVAMFGYPQPGGQIAVAVARLASPAEPPKRTNEAAAERAKLAYATAGEREKAVTRAAMLCGDPQFMGWVGAVTPEEAAMTLRRRLSVRSRGEISSDDEAYRKFIALELEYRQAHGLEAERRDR